MSKGSRPPQVQFGVSGWDYRDWHGPLYPLRPGRGFRALPLIARFLDFVEVNVTFYRLLPAGAVERWIAETPPTFGFVVKAWRGWTHEGEAVKGDDCARFRELLEPLAVAGRLLAVLAQFPPSFRDDGDGRQRIEALAELVAPAPLAVEVRRRELYRRSFLDFLAAGGIDFVNVDLPPVGTLPGLTRINTGRLGFVRLHGRNRRSWSDPRAGRDDRYDHQYSTTELAEVVASIDALAARVPRVVVAANNHFEAHAAAAAVELRSRWSGAPVPAPAPLIDSHPGLARFAAPLDDRPLTPGLELDIDAPRRA